MISEIAKRPITIPTWSRQIQAFIPNCYVITLTSEKSIISFWKGYYHVCLIKLILSSVSTQNIMGNTAVSIGVITHFSCIFFNDIPVYLSWVDKCIRFDNGYFQWERIVYFVIRFLFSTYHKPDSFLTNIWWRVL